MKNKKQRKGFTLVELLVVIAILAVLATVAILGYTQFTKKANIANDQAICSQMNLALQSNEALDNKARYAHEAVGQCQDAGFILENLTPSTADFHFAYDQKYNRFMLLDKDFNFNYGDTKHSEVGSQSVNVFVVVGNQKEFNESKEKDFSAYLRHDFDETVTTLTTNKGIDVGECTTVTSITYNNANSEEGQEVVIRTNGGKLTVNAPNDHMEHFGTLDFLQIDAIKTTASYVENGYTAQGQIKVGRVVNTKGTIEVDGETKATGVENLFLETNEQGNGFGTIVIASKDGANLPTLDRGEVTIGDGVLVVEIQELTGETKTSDEYIWLFGNGTVEAEKVVVTASSEKPSVETFDLDTSTKSGKAGEQIANVPGKAKASKEDVEKGTTLFAGGTGTEVNPYLISKPEHFYAIQGTEGKCFAQLNDIVIVNQGWNQHGLVKAKDLTYNGNNYSIFIDENEASRHYDLFGPYGETYISNVNFYSNEKQLVSLIDSVNYASDQENVLTNITLKNCNARTNFGGVIETSITNGSLFIINGPDDEHDNVRIVIEDCNNYVSYNNTSTCTGIFLAWGALCDGSKITLKNCNNYGVVSGQTNCGFVCGHMYFNYEGANGQKEKYEVINCHNYGLIKASTSVGVFADAGYQDQQNIMNGIFGFDQHTFIKTAPLTEDFEIYYNNGALTVYPSSNEYDYNFKLGLHPQTVNLENGFVNNTTYLVFDAEISNEGTKISKENIKYVDVKTAIDKGIIGSASGLSFMETGKYSIAFKLSGETLYVICNTSFVIDCNGGYSIYAYSNGTNVGYKEY